MSKILPEKIDNIAFESFNIGKISFTCEISKIAVTFNFASPANRNVTGPIERFVNMVSGPVYGQMVDHLGAVYEKVKIKGDSASIDVIIKVVSGKFVGFRFLLTKQRDNEFDETWMTDSVTPIEVISS